MYELYKNSENSYEIHSNYSGFKAKEGTLTAICVYMVSLGFDLSEIEIGLVEMIRTDHNGAHFGINKMFIFPINRVERRKAG